MKKVIYSFIMLAAVALTSCEKDEIGGTATEALAGEWYVTADWADDNGDVVMEDPFGAGQFIVNTYNTAANVPTEMWLDDLGNYWEFKVKIASDINALTFKTNGAVKDVYNDIDVTIEGGKILPGAATTPHGTPADSIVFYVSFSDDYANYQQAYGYTKYKFSGYRYTGLASDD